MITEKQIKDAKAKDPEAGLLFDGPWAEPTDDGDEIPVWSISLIDSAGDDFGPVEEYYDYEVAKDRAEQLAKRSGLEFLCEGRPA